MRTQALQRNEVRTAGKKETMADRSRDYLLRGRKGSTSGKTLQMFIIIIIIISYPITDFFFSWHSYS
jgi:hypothetical protein